MSRARHHGEDFYINCDCDHCEFMARQSCQCMCRQSDEDADRRRVSEVVQNELLKELQQDADNVMRRREKLNWTRADSEALANAHAMRVRASGPAGIWLW